jgi:hypothetical protein
MDKTAKKTLKMAQKKKQTYNISDFFGAYNTYRIFAMQSELPTFMFANQLGKATQTSFTMLPEFEQNRDRYSALFSVFYAVYSQQESIHCLLLENKAAISNQQELFVSKAEQNLSFQTLSLFDEYLYLFNRQGLRCFDMKFDDMDYLLLLFAKKEIDHDMFSRFFKSLEPFKTQDVSYLIKKEQTATEAKNVAFLRDFYCKYEVKANQFSRRKERELLAPVKQIPAQNLQFPIPARLEFNAVADYLQISEEYLQILKDF